MPFIETITSVNAVQYVTALNIDSVGSIGAKAAAITVWCCVNQTWNTNRVRKYFGYDWADIRSIFSNLRKNKYCDEYGIIEVLLPDPIQNPIEFIVELSLIAGCCGGSIKRV